MTKLLMLAVLVGLVAQSPQDGYDKDGHLKAEHQIPAGDYCKRSDVTIRPSETHAHHCDCTYACTVDENGNVNEFEGEKQPKCKSYCSKDGRRCTCHVEEPCDRGGSATVDMNGQIVAVKRHH